MPELPEVEAWRRSLGERLRGAVVEQAGPAHIATLKTFDPPLTALRGKRLAGVERRGKRLLFAVERDDLVLLVHLMSAGRLKMIEPGGKRPGQPAFRLGLADGGELVLTEAGRKKRAGVWLLTREAAAEELAHLGPEADTIGEVELAAILRAESRRLHSFLRDQRALAGIGRAWANEILHEARLSPYALTTELAAAEVTRLHAAIRAELARGLALRERGATDAKVYRVHRRLGAPCHVCGTPLAQVDFEEHTIFYCPQCQTGGRVLKDRRMSRLLR